jgi:hypothetical protein
VSEVFPNIASVVADILGICWNPVRVFPVETFSPVEVE